jgi:hypothetical protein
MKKEKRPDWNEEILELEGFFNSQTRLRKEKLNAFTTITNPKLFIKAHLDIAKNNNGIPTFRPYLDRLIEYRKLIEKSNH